MASHACLVARDAAYNFGDLVANSSSLAFQAIQECEKELDQIEREIDEKLAAAITRVSESRARELLACLKFIIDLERIGDLILSAAHRFRHSHSLDNRDTRQLAAMSAILQRMLEQIQLGFVQREVSYAAAVLQADTEVDQTRFAIFQRHLRARTKKGSEESSIDVLFMAQALERAGDHAKNLAEELYSLVEGHTLRHVPKKQRTSRLAGL